MIKKLPDYLDHPEVIIESADGKDSVACDSRKQFQRESVHKINELVDVVNALVKLVAIDAVNRLEERSLKDIPVVTAFIPEDESND